MQNNFDKDFGKRVAEAVVVAGLSAFVGGLVSWGLEEIRNFIKPPKKEQ